MFQFFKSVFQANTTSAGMEEISVNFNPWKIADYLNLDQSSPLEDNDALLEGRIQRMNITTTMSHPNISVEHTSYEEEIEGSGTE